MEPIDLEDVPQYAEFYPTSSGVMSVLNAVPEIKELIYFKLQTSRNEIIDVE